ncbi:MAG: 4Fe-4S binding protein [Acidobacteria bacterium]|nr:4Fe-4S binding protein [Acidobacteriota bacterium]
MSTADVTAGLVKIGQKPDARFDLLRFGAVRKFVRWRGYPYIFQVAALSVFIGLAVLGWGRLTPEGVPDKLYAKANLVNLVIWGLFWPSMIWMAVVFGRVWCAVCPLELVSDVGERIGRVLRIPQRDLGRWLRAGWLMVVLYALIQLLVAGIHLHRVPAYSSVFLLGLLSLATATGLLFRNRAFCRGFCPVAPLLRVYGRGGMVAVRPGPAAHCQVCEGKPCVSAAHRNKWDARSCPSLLNAEKLNSSEECLACTQCVKVCAPGNMRLLIRRPYDRADARTPLATWALTAFIMLLSGFVTGEVTSEWPAAQKVFQTPIHWIVQFTGMGGAAGWVEGLWMLVMFPLLLWLALGMLTVWMRGANGLFEAWRRMALPMGIVIAAGHMSKGLAKFVSWVGYLPAAVQEPEGVSTSMAMAAKAVPTPATILSLPWVATIGVVLTFVGLCLAIREYRILDGSPCIGRVLPHALMAGVYSFVIFGWGFLQ